MPAMDQRVFAKWDTLTYNISYNLEQDIANPNDDLISFKEVDLPIDLYPLQKDGKHFEGWYTDQNLTQKLGNNHCAAQAKPSHVS